MPDPSRIPHELPSDQEEARAFLSPGATDPGIVRLSTGTVELDRTLASLGAGEGVQLALSLRYSSDSRSAATRSNAVAPDGILGHGWELPRPRVVRVPGSTTDHFAMNLDGRLHSLEDNGAPHRGCREFRSPLEPFWRVRYSVATERWEVLKENGVLCVFGGSDAAALEKDVHWKGWRGIAASPGGALEVSAWNLVSIEDRWGTRILLSYEQDGQPLGAGLPSVTRQTRLVRVEAPDGEAFVVGYSSKTPPERGPARDPVERIFPAEKYLDHVEILGAGGYRRDVVSLGYHFIGSGTSLRRALTSITRRDSDGDETCETFEWKDGALVALTDPLGAKTTIGYSEIELEPEQDLGVSRPGDSSDWTHPRTYFGPDYVLVCWTGRNTRAGRLSVSVHRFADRWSSKQCVELNGRPEDLDVRLGQDAFLLAVRGSSGVEVFTASPYDPHRWTGSHHALDCGNAELAAGQSYFAHLDRSRRELTLLSLRRDGTVATSKKAVGFDCAGLILTMCGGDDYVAIAAIDPAGETGAVLRLMAAGEDLDAREWTHTFARDFVPAKTSSLLAVARQRGPTDVELVADGGLVVLSLATTLESSFASRPTGLVSFHHFVAYAGEARNHDGLRVERLGAPIERTLGATCRTSIHGSLVIADLDVTMASERRTFRYAGNRWIEKNFPTSDLRFAFAGQDCLTTNHHGDAQLHAFDPRTLSWVDAGPSYRDGSPTLFEKIWKVAFFIEGLMTLPLSWEWMALDVACFIADVMVTELSRSPERVLRERDRYFTSGNLLLLRDQLTWRSLGALAEILPPEETTEAFGGHRRWFELDLQNTQLAEGFLSYVLVEHRTTTLQRLDHTRIDVPDAGYPRSRSFLQRLGDDGRVGAPIELPEDESLRWTEDSGPVNLIGRSMFATYLGGASLATATSLHLYAWTGGRFRGRARATVASVVNVEESAAETRSLRYAFAARHSRIRSGEGGLFHSTSVSFGHGNDVSRERDGLSVQHHITDPSVLSTAEQELSQGIGSLGWQDHPALVRGLGYRHEIYDGTGRSCAVSQVAWGVIRHSLAGRSEALVRPVMQEQAVEGVVQREIREYLREGRVVGCGAPIRTRTRSVGSDGLWHEDSHEFIYAHERFFDLVEDNVLDRVAVQRRLRDGIVTQLVATDWYTGNRVYDRDALSARPILLTPQVHWQAIAPDADPHSLEQERDPATWRLVSRVLGNDPVTGAPNSWQDDRGVVRSAIIGTGAALGQILAVIDDARLGIEADLFTGARGETLDRFVIDGTLTPGEGWLGDAGITGRPGAPASIRPVLFTRRADRPPYYVAAWVRAKEGSPIEIGIGARPRTLRATGRWQRVVFAGDHRDTDYPYVRCDGVIGGFLFAPVDSTLRAELPGADARRTVRVSAGLMTRTALLDARGGTRAILQDETPIALASRNVSGRAELFVRCRGGGRYYGQGAALGPVADSPERNYGVLLTFDRRSIDGPVITDGTGHDRGRQRQSEHGLEIGGLTILSDGGALRVIDRTHRERERHVVALGRQWWVAVLGSTLIVVIDGVPVLQEVYGHELVGPLSIIEQGDDPIVPVVRLEMIIARDPIIQMTYRDTLGRVRQRVRVDETARGSVIEAVIHDGWGNVVFRSQPRRLDGLDLRERAAFIGGVDFRTGRVTGEISAPSERAREGLALDASVDPATWGHWTFRERSPLARVLGGSGPGSESRPLNSSHEFSAKARALARSLGFPSDTESGLRSLTTEGDGSGAPTSVDLMDAGGGMLSAGLVSHAGVVLATRRTLVSHAADGSTFSEAQLPGSFAPVGQGLNGYRCTQRRSFDGASVEFEHPDEGASRTLFERTGKVRFFVDAAGLTMDPPLIWYRKYDRRGREIENGSLRARWELAQKHVDDPRWPEEAAADLAVVVRMRATFDFTDDSFDGRQFAPGRILERTRLTPGQSPAREYWRYDEQDRLRAKFQSCENARIKIEYSLDRLGSLTSLSSQGSTLHYDYDSAGHLRGIGTAPKQHDLAAFAWTADGRLLRETRDGGRLVRELRYDQRRRPVSITELASDGAVILDERLEYGEDLRIRRRRLSGRACARPLAFVFEHDAQGRLSAATSEVDDAIGAHGDSLLDRRYAYDEHANQVVALVGGSVHQFSHARGTDRIDAVDGVREFAYDRVGRITKRGSTTIAYDEQTGLPTRLSLSNPERAFSFGYDAAERLVTVREVGADGDSLVELVHGDGGRPIAEIGRRDTTVLVNGPTGCLAMLRSDGARAFPIRDYLGSARAMVEPTSGVVHRVEYDPFGRSIRGTSAGAPLALRRGFGDYIELTDTGLLHAGARIYDPLLARFTSPDPRRQLDSPYAFAGGAPLHRIDPDGRASLDALRVGVGLATTAIHAGLGALLGGGIIGAAIDSKTKVSAGGMNAKQLGAIIGASAGAAIGLVRLFVDAVALPLARAHAVAAVGRTHHPIILFNPEQEFMPAGAEMVAEAEGIPRSAWSEHLMPFSEIGTRKPAAFDGRLIVVAHGQVSGHLETGVPTLGYNGDITGAEFVNLIDPAGPTDIWARSVNRIDFCSCYPGSTSFRSLMKSQLQAERQGTRLNPRNVNGWLADGGTTPVSLTFNWGQIRSSEEWSEYLYYVFPFYTPGVRMPASMTAADIGPWRKLY